MSKLTISVDGRHLEWNAAPFFWLADTVWSAFTNITLDDWRYYLKKRREQGFNVLQINTLAQWDRGESPLGRTPFSLNEQGEPDYTQINQAYFDNAREMCAMARDEGFQLALVVLWCNQVPGTWANNYVPFYTIPKELLQSILCKIYDSFDEFEPIYVVSGDTDFPTAETVEYYQTAFDMLRQRGYHGLTTMHIKGRFTDIPEQFAQQMDFYLYQSGHNISAQSMAYTSAEVMAHRTPTRPVINSEPCYEQMGYSHNLYGRFTQQDVRRAAWQSLLSGACAGVTYGAHGVWNWVSEGYRSSLAMGEGFDSPLPHQQALELPGAWDYGFAKTLFEQMGLGTLTNCNELVMNESPEIRMARAEGTSVYLIYLPVNTKLSLRGMFANHLIKAYDLTSRRTAYLSAKFENGVTSISMHPFEQDALIVIQ